MIEPLIARAALRIECNAMSRRRARCLTFGVPIPISAPACPPACPPKTRPEQDGVFQVRARGASDARAASCWARARDLSAGDHRRQPQWPNAAEPAANPFVTRPQIRPNSRRFARAARRDLDRLAILASGRAVAIAAYKPLVECRLSAHDLLIGPDDLRTVTTIGGLVGVIDSAAERGAILKNARCNGSLRRKQDGDGRRNGETRDAARGREYVFGANVRSRIGAGPWDCAEFASWLVFQNKPASDRLRQDVAAERRTLSPAHGRMTAEDPARSSRNMRPESYAARAGAPAAQRQAGSRFDFARRRHTIEAMDHVHGVAVGKIDGRRWDVCFRCPASLLTPRRGRRTRPQRAAQNAC